jgi:predicted ATP-dependent protease
MVRQTEEQAFMADTTSLSPEQLCRRCDPAQFDFDDTRALPEAAVAFGHDRALEALRLALEIPGRGYNVFVLGLPGSGRRAVVQRLLQAHTAQAPRPAALADWCYLHNFDAPNQPRALRLPPGEGSRFKRAMQGFCDELDQAIAGALDSAVFRTRIAALNKTMKQREESLLQTLGDDAAKQDIALLRTAQGLAFSPTQAGEPLATEAFHALSDEAQQRINEKIDALGQRLQQLLHELPRLRREMQRSVRDATREALALATGHLIEELKSQFAALPAVLSFLDTVALDVVASGSQLHEVAQDGDDDEDQGSALGASVTLQRYGVNLLVSHDAQTRAPVIYADNPSLPNLVGRVDPPARMDALLSDFTLIQAGALHRANGGFLLLDAAKVVLQPNAWEALKRTLRAGTISIESLPQAMGWVTSVPLEPEAVPVELKVVLFGEREDYYLLQEFDAEFDELFKIAADFDDDVVRDATNTRALVQLLAAMAHTQALRPLDRGAAARLVEHAARMAEDAGKLSTRTRELNALLHESHALAGRAGRAVTGQGDVVQALAARQRRANRLREQVQDAVLRELLLIGTDGQQIGQVNGLAVAELGDLRFAHPVRITATVRLGEGQVLDIERESELGGPVHAKGVLILGAFLGARYAAELPLSLAASLVFEQSYDSVEGDSASLAELCALLSALAAVPIQQSLAVTGSINQFGHVQAIGAVNEKIEGFFDICQARGLTGQQGVLVPRANVQHLMLRDDVVAAVRDGLFRVHAIDNVDQALALLTGLPAGAPDARGHLPQGSVNQRVAAQLAHLSQLRQAFEMGLDRPMSQRMRRRARVQREESRAHSSLKRRP